MEKRKPPVNCLYRGISQFYRRISERGQFPNRFGKGGLLFSTLKPPVNARMVHALIGTHPGIVYNSPITGPPSLSRLRPALYLLTASSIASMATMNG
jgi:hypothetical protein